MHLITFGQTLIPYEIVRSNKRKTVSITVDKDGVKVIAPIDVEIEKIQDVVKNKVTWIRKQLLHFEEINDYRHQRLFLSGEKLPYLGRQYRLKVISNTEITVPNFKFSQGTFFAEVPATLKKEQYRDTLFPLYEDWIKTKAMKYVNNRISRYTTILQITPSTISIKTQEQRWGSCTPGLSYFDQTSGDKDG